MILVNFNDTTNTSSHTPSYYDDLLFGSGQGSMRQYFEDASYGVFSLGGNTSQEFYTASRSEAYYGTYEFGSPGGATYGNSQDLTYEAVKAADDDIDYSKYDKDSDGYVDFLVIVHAGEDDANDGDSTGPGGDPQMWSHAWALNAMRVKLDGVWINRFIMLSEFSPVGTFIHEYGHSLGLPDLYDIDYSSDGGCGDWEAMASGSWNDAGRTPAMLSAWSRIKLGWLSPTTVSVSTSGLVAKRVEDNQTVFKIWVNASNDEYFLVENRQQVGWDRFAPGSGILIWHINDNVNGNANDDHRQVNLEQYDDNGRATDASDAWKDCAIGMTPITSPDTSDDSGKSTGIRIYNISDSGDTMYFDVSFVNSAPNAPIPTALEDGTWIGESRPKLEWNPSDADSGDFQTAYRLQVDDDSTFSSVDWDSSEVVSSESACTVSTLLGEGKWYWRVRTRDTCGAWGAYNSVSVRCFNVDLTAPAAPGSLVTTPDSWTRVNSFTVNWTFPDEQGTSGIKAGVYYSIDAIPTGPRDGRWVTTKPITGISLSGAGEHKIYLWLEDNVGNIDEDNLASATLLYDAVPPTNPTSLTSPTHVVSEWSNGTVIQVRWTGAADSHSGVDGFSILWDSSADSLPDAEADCAGTAAETYSPELTDGTYYFHVRAVDRVGNWAPTASHLGPFLIDLTPPEGAQGLSSSTHTVGVWSNEGVIEVRWWGASDLGSGVGGYAYEWDQLPTTVPDGSDMLDAQAASSESPAIDAGGNYYFHLRVVDAVGNWNATAHHIGPFMVDVLPPTNPTGAEVLSDHTIDVWTSERLVRVRLTGHVDALSGVGGFSVGWGHDPDGTVDDVVDVTGTDTFELEVEGRAYLYARAVDNAGNWNPGCLAIGPFLVDLDAPTTPVAVAETLLTNTSTVAWSWEEATDASSGVAGYQVWVVNDVERPEAGLLFTTTVNAFAVQDALNGLVYHLRARAVDAVGNIGDWGDFSEGVLVDLAPPHDLRVRIGTGANFTNDPSMVVSVSAFDDESGVAAMRFSLDGLVWTEWQSPTERRTFDFTDGDGLKSVFLQAVDNAGNVADAVNASVTLDTTGPEVLSFDTVDGPTLLNHSVVRLVVVARDALTEVTGVRLVGEGQDWWPYGAVIECALEGGDGPKLLRVESKDALGNVGPASELLLTLDTTGPAAPRVSSATHPRSATWYSSREISFEWTPPVDEAGIVGYSYVLADVPGTDPDDRLLTTGTEVALSAPEGGRWYLRVKALDGAGNWGTVAECLVSVDPDGPTIPEMLSPANGSWYMVNDTVTISWSEAEDQLSGMGDYVLQVDDDADFSSPLVEEDVSSAHYQITNVERGKYYLRVRARDKVSNLGEWGPVTTFVVRAPESIGVEGEMPDMLLVEDPMQLLYLVIVLTAVFGAVAAAAGRRGNKGSRGGR